MDVVLVVERGLFDGCATDYYGHQLGEGIQGARATYVDPDVQKLGCCLLGGELVGDSPSRFPAHEAQLLLQGDLVYLNNHAVGGVVEVCQMLFPALEVGLDLFDVVNEFRVGADPEAEGLEILEHFPVGVRDGAFGVTEAVDEDVQWSLGGDPGVELADGAGGGVSRVDVKRLTGLLPLAVKLLQSR